LDRISQRGQPPIVLLLAALPAVVVKPEAARLMIDLVQISRVHTVPGRIVHAPIARHSDVQNSNALPPIRSAMPLANSLLRVPPAAKVHVLSPPVPVNHGQAAPGQTTSAQALSGNPDGRQDQALPTSLLQDLGQNLHSVLSRVVPATKASPAVAEANPVHVPAAQGRADQGAAVRDREVPGPAENGRAESPGEGKSAADCQVHHRHIAC
jgi:hypothetical protein